MAQSLADAAMLSRTHGQPATPTTHGQGDSRTSRTACAARASASPRSRSRERSTARWATTTPTSPRIRTSTGKRFAKRFVESLGPGVQSLHHPDRAARQLRRAVRRVRARQHRAPRSRPRRLGLRLARLLQAEDQGGRGRLLDHAAQGEPHRLRELRRQPRRRATRCCAIFPRSCPVSRWQRDLSDSTVQRNIGVALGHTPARLRVLR